MIVNQSENDRNRVWKIGRKEVERTNEYKYLRVELGIWRSPFGYEKINNLNKFRE